MKTLIKQRSSNIELLRIISMLMVMFLHIPFLVGDDVASTDITKILPIDIVKYGIHSLCVMAVNVFVMISGWFLIKPSVKGFSSFMWQVFFMVCCGVLFFHFIFNTPFGKYPLLEPFGLCSGGGWFVPAYMGLYILAPVLNSYIRTSSDRQQVILLVVFFIFQYIYGSTMSANWVAGGYSAFSFIGLYILSNLLNRNQDKFKTLKLIGILITCVLFNTAIFSISILTNNVIMNGMVYHYSSPIIIIQAATTLILFSRIKIKRGRVGSIINWTARGCFAVLLFHMASDEVFHTFLGISSKIVSRYSGMELFVFLILLALGTYITAIIIDVPRRIIWDKVISRVFKK